MNGEGWGRDTPFKNWSGFWTLEVLLGKLLCQVLVYQRPSRQDTDKPMKQDTSCSECKAE